MEQLIALRHQLHQHPELSGCEVDTAERICQFLEHYAPYQLLRNVGGHGVIAIYQGLQPGSTVLFRCDMDAVPVQEGNAFAYCSQRKGVAHSCGHDGHMAIVAGLAERFNHTPLQRGRVMLLFQPAEETGKGAALVVEHLRSHPELLPDYAIALHNQPQHSLGKVLLRRDAFAAASKGVIIELRGRQSHAAHPERGLNPAAATDQLLQQLLDMPAQGGYADFVLCTLVHVRLGDVAFGTSAGEATIMATLRAFDNADMQLLTQRCTNAVQQIASQQGLTHGIRFVEEFPATVNDPHLLQHLETLCSDHGWLHGHLPESNRWSEDFAHFGSLCPSLMFGLGAGEQHPELHTSTYDFPDALIERGADIMEALARRILA